MLTQKELKEILDYDPDTGIFRWKVSRGRVKKGSIAKREIGDGYLGVQIDGKNYLLHRLAWLYVYSVFPSQIIDHIDKDKKNNRISNLRDVSYSENNINCKIQKNNKSGTNGVYWNKQISKWVVKFVRNINKIYLGHFETLEEAEKAARKFIGA